MPIVAGWIDEMREVFGVDEINHQIKQGMAGKQTFFASEAGYEIGTVFSGGHAVDLRDMVLTTRKEVESNERRRK